MSAQEIVNKLNLATSSDTGLIEELVKQVLSEFPEKVAEFKGGKKGLLGMFVGEVMKRSKGKADTKTTNQWVNKMLND